MSEITMLVQTTGSQMNEIILAGGKMILCALGSLISSITVALLAAKIGINFSANVREKLFNRSEEPHV